MSRFISQDMFGHPVNFSFNKKGVQHKTAIGGCCSLIIRAILAVYAGVLLKRMLYLEGNTNETFILTEEENQEVKFGESDIKYTITLFDLVTN